MATGGERERDRPEVKENQENGSVKKKCDNGSAIFCGCLMIFFIFANNGDIVC